MFHRDVTTGCPLSMSSHLNCISSNGVYDGGRACSELRVSVGAQ